MCHVTEQGMWPLEGYFECAGSDLFVKLECLGGAYESQTALRPITVLFPHSDNPDFNMPLARPAWKFVHPDRPGDTAPNADPRWGAIGSMTEPDEKFPGYAAVHSCLVYASVQASDEDDFRKKVSGFTRELDAWWTAFTDWLGVMSVQNFVGLGRRPRSILEHGVHAWSGDQQGNRHTACGAVVHVVPAEPETLTRAEIERAMVLARHSTRPPVAWRLIADAGPLLMGRENRRAVLEAGTAAELALHALLEQEIPGIQLDRHTLGMLRDEADRRIPQLLPGHVRDDLVLPRNDAIHRASEEPDRPTAAQAVVKAAEVVQAAYPDA